MVESAACVFSSDHLRVRCVLREDGDERALCACGNAYCEIDDTVFPVGIFEVEIGLGSGGGVGNRARECGAVTAYKLFRAIDDHLRRVDVAESKALAVFLLARSHGVQRKRVAPTKPVPVGDVFAEHNGMGGWDKLGCVEACKQGIGRRAVGAPFRGEQLNEDGLNAGGGGRLGRGRGCEDRYEEGGDEDHAPTVELVGKRESHAHKMIAQGRGLHEGHW